MQMLTEGLQKCQNAAKKRNGEFLSSEYSGMNKKYRWRCDKNHIFETSAGSVVNSNSWCVICHLTKDYQRIFDLCQKVAVERGGKFLCSFEEFKGTGKKYEWECAKGHRWMKPPVPVYHNGTWCRRCISSGYWENFCRSVMEQLYESPFPSCFPKWLINPKTSRLLELDGYSEELGIAFEFQGIQHYEITKFNKKITDLEVIKERDAIKVTLCKEQGISLIIIPTFERMVPEWGKNIRYDNIVDFIHFYCEREGISKPKTKEVDLKIALSDSTQSKQQGKLLNLKKIAEIRGGELRSNIYMGNKVKLLFYCKKHDYEFMMVPMGVTKGNWCSKCGAEKSADVHRIKGDITLLKNLAEKDPHIDGKCLSTEFLGWSNRHIWKCGNEEHPSWEASLRDISRGQWCKKCGATEGANKKRQAYLAANGLGRLDFLHTLAKQAPHETGKCLAETYVNATVKYLWKCGDSTHAVWYAELNSIKKGTWCPECAKLNIKAHRRE